jgi:hypothetical protein
MSFASRARAVFGSFAGANPSWWAAPLPTEVQWRLGPSEGGGSGWTRAQGANGGRMMDLNQQKEQFSKAFAHAVASAAGART